MVCACYLDAGTPLGRSHSRSSSRRVTSRSRSWPVSHVKPHRFELMVAVDRRRLPSGSASIMSSRPGSGGAARAPPKPVAPLSVEPLLSGCSPRFSSRTGDVKSAELPITASGRRPSGNRSAASLGGQAPAGACGRRLHHATFTVYRERRAARPLTWRLNTIQGAVTGTAHYPQLSCCVSSLSQGMLYSQRNLTTATLLSNTLSR